MSDAVLEFRATQTPETVTCQGCGNLVFSAHVGGDSATSAIERHARDFHGWRGILELRMDEPTYPETGVIGHKLIQVREQPWEKTFRAVVGKIERALQLAGIRGPGIPTLPDDLPRVGHHIRSAAFWVNSRAAYLIQAVKYGPPPASAEEWRADHPDDAAYLSGIMVGLAYLAGEREEAAQWDAIDAQLTPRRSEVAS
jgi:hypothetical protein